LILHLHPTILHDIQTQTTAVSLLQLVNGEYLAVPSHTVLSASQSRWQVLARPIYAYDDVHNCCVPDGADVLFNKFNVDSSSPPDNPPRHPNSDYSCVVATTGQWRVSRCTEQHRVVCQSIRHAGIITCLFASWLSGYGVGFVTERSRVRLPAGPLSSNNSGQVVHTYVPV